MEISERILIVWRLPLAVLALCCLATSAVLLVSRALPAPPDDSVILRSRCTLPCLFGITPGETTRDEAISTLTQYAETTQISDYLISFPLVDPAGRTAIVSASFDANASLTSVRIIAVDPLADVGQLSDLLLAGQQPHRVFRTCDGMLPVRFLMTFGEVDQLLVELFPGDLAPNIPITFFDLGAGTQSLTNARSSFGCSVETGWHGFAPLWKYRAAS